MKNTVVFLLGLYRRIVPQQWRIKWKMKWKLGVYGLVVKLGLYRGYIGIMENKMETTIVYRDKNLGLKV